MITYNTFVDEQRRRWNFIGWLTETAFFEEEVSKRLWGKTKDCLLEDGIEVGDKRLK